MAEVRVVLRIEIAGPDRKARRLSFGAEDQRSTSAAALKALGVEAGDSIDLDELKRVEADAARERALRYLGYRDRTRHEVVKRLKDDGYPDELAQSVCQWLSDLDFVDDERLARQWARSRAAGGYGPRRILQDLSRRGVASDMARRVVADLGGDEDERAQAIVGPQSITDSKQRQRLVRKLVGRGFDLATALRAVDHNDAD